MPCLSSHDPARNKHRHGDAWSPRTVVEILARRGSGPNRALRGRLDGHETLAHQPNERTDRSIDAAYNPATNAWRRLPTSPYRVRSGEGGTQIAWDGEELLTFGVMNAALDPATGRWRPLTPPPLPAASVALCTVPGY